MKYLLDTNACVQFLRGKQASDVGGRIAQLPAGDELVTCSIVMPELLFGAYRSGQPAQNLLEVEDFIAPLNSLPFDDATSRIHASIRADLARQGNPIGPYDLMIAAIAIQHTLTVVTHNVGEFSRVPGLQIEDWQTP